MKFSVLFLSVLFLSISTLGFSSSKQASSEPASAQADDLGKQDVAKETAAEKGESIWVVKNVGKKQCEPESGLSEVQMRATLEAARVKVLASKPWTDGKMRVRMCGADAGDFFAFQIPRGQLAQASKSGFETMPKTQE